MGGNKVDNVGNNISSKEEEQIADYLRERTLDHANAISRPVNPRKTLYTCFGKRIIDLIIIVPALIVLSPLFLILTILNLIFMGRPVFFKQTRFGYKGKNYEMLKFRSMKNSLDKEGRQLPNEKRLTKYGRFIRKYSLDELPNLVNILRGEMSIIGPRAVPLFYKECMTERHKMMSAVRPGLECPRMIGFEWEGRVTDYHITFENNIWYVENISLLTDIKMIFKLIKMTFSLGERGKHAGALAYFVGYDDDGIALYTELAKEIYGDQMSLGESE